MDKNTITGLILIFTILITFSYLNSPSESQQQAAKHQQDSIAQVATANAQQSELKAKQLAAAPSATLLSSSDTSKNAAGNELKSLYGVFSEAVKGTEYFITLENNLMKIKVSNKGGKIYSVELKGYKRFNGEPLLLFEGEKNRFGLNFFSQNKSIQTDQFYFVPSLKDSVLSVSGAPVSKGKEGREEYNAKGNDSSKSISMLLDAGNGVKVEYVYTIKHNSFMVGFDVRTSGLKKVMGANSNYINLNWTMEMPRQEMVSKFGEDNYATAYYKYFKDEVGEIPPAKSETKALTTKVEWISFKTLFFSSALIADKTFLNGQVTTKKRDKDVAYVSDMSADLTLPLDNSGSETFPARFYFGPNHYNTLKQYDVKLEEELSLGWTVIGWTNKYIIIPAFDFLRRYISNFGLIILLLTIYVKLIVAPFTYKSYISQAKMRLLKPEIEEIQKKFGEDKKLESQQAVMGLYKKAGVNPMGGCLPMIFQMPILVAMFYFFPISIELRQQSFLWAHDLSAFDSIATLPFDIPWYGHHVSLFCLLMTVTNILYVKYNNEMSATGSQQMPGMKTMMYLMPVMFLFIFNSYASGLSLYYFLSLVFTFVQMFIFKKLVNEDEIHAQLKAKQKMPVVKSKFQARLEEMAKQRNVPQKKK
ncbi:MAG: membrane protein insertase YidC [Bacteroidia bacterium]|nr:membrane protein insertase YidC [Bacteroidia bacterium]